MKKRANVFLWLVVLAALCVLGPSGSPASAASAGTQAGEDRWVPSLTITSGVLFQPQEGAVDSLLLGPPTVPLRDPTDGDDLAVGPFVGGALELMTPALPIPTRPRIFVSGEIVPTFASERDLALEGDPFCVSGPEPDAPCATNEPRNPDGSPVRARPFDENTARGQGSSTNAEIDTLVFGANLGVAFPLQFMGRQLRIKPSVAWIHYEIRADGVLVDAACTPNFGLSSGCTDVGTRTGYLRQPERFQASASEKFNAVGPGLDVEMDAFRSGPLGISLFLGGRFYANLGDRKFSFGTQETVGAPSEPFGEDTAVARFEVEMDPWMYRAHVGIRLLWLGSRP
jgi:hypothetical protein